MWSNGLKKVLDVQGLNGDHGFLIHLVGDNSRPLPKVEKAFFLLLYNFFPLSSLELRNVMVSRQQPAQGYSALVTHINANFWSEPQFQPWAFPCTLLKSETTSEKLSWFPRISTGREVFPLCLRYTSACVSLSTKGNPAVAQDKVVHISLPYLVMKLPFWAQLPEVFPWVLTGCFTETISPALLSTFTQHFYSQSCKYSPTTSQIIKCLLRYCKKKLS